jgi:hypothetical protein
MRRDDFILLVRRPHADSNVGTPLRLAAEAAARAYGRNAGLFAQIVDLQETAFDPTIPPCERVAALRALRDVVLWP